jgi:coenzyme F420-0:L-glutamate ligase/coenzyme F420-1:gamma-L-glutamate ligase
VSVSLHPVVGVGQVRAGDDLAAVLAAALRAHGPELRDGDVLVVCQKVVSKAEGRIVDLSSVEPSKRAREFAQCYGKDPALVELVLRESREVLRMNDGHLITATGPGFVCANAGIDRSNQERGGEATLLPVDADASARALRTALGRTFGVEIALVVSDTFGRPWRLGQIDFAIGAAGIEVLDDHVGRRDWSGRMLEHTVIATADQLAAAAGLVMGKDAGVPAVVVRGYVYRPGASGAADLVRPREEDLFR